MNKIEIEAKIKKFEESLNDFLESGACSTFRGEVAIEIEDKIAELKELLK